MGTLLVYLFDNYRLDENGFRLERLGHKVPLEPKCLRVLLLLVSRQGEVIPKSLILNTVWNDTFVEEKTLTRAIALIRKELGDDARQPRFIETVPTVGFRFIAPVTTPSLAGVGLGTEVAITPSAPAETVHPLKKAGTIPAIVLAGIALLAFSGWMVQRQLSKNKPIRSLAVLPLANLSGDASQDYFADGMTDQLITELAHVPGLRVVSQTSAAQDKAAHKPLREIAQELDVDAIVEGSIVRSGDKVRITAQMIDMRTNQHVWANSFEGPVGDILPIQDSVAQQIASQTKVVLGSSEHANIKAARSVSPAAFDAYLRGRYFFQKRDIKLSISYFQQAVSLDPSYAPAYAGLADALGSSSALGVARPEDAMPAAAAAARHAIELDPQNGEAYSALGSIDTDYAWDWHAAERDIQKAIQLDPNNSLAEMRFAAYLDAIGRPEEAVAHMRRAVLLDPLSFYMNRHLGSTLYFARHYDEALYYLRRAGEMEPAHAGLVRNWMSWTDEAKGMKDQAVQDDLAASGADPSNEDPGSLRFIYQHDGWKAYWQARIRQMQTKQTSCTPYFMAAAYLRIGDNDSAFSKLNDAVDRKCLWVISLKVDPLMDAARTDGRYGPLLRRVNLSNP